MDDLEYSKLEQYFAEKKEYYSRPENLKRLEQDVENILQFTEFNFMERVAIRWTFEFILMIIDTPKGKELFIKLLEFIKNDCPDLAEMYWSIYDDQENIIEKHYIPSLQMPNLKKLLDELMKGDRMID